jgi:hypothetical protein
MQQRKSKASENTTGASSIGLKTGDRVPYAEMGYAVPKAKPKTIVPKRPSAAEPTTGARAIGLKTGDRVPRELSYGSYSKMMGIKKK